MTCRKAGEHLSSYLDGELQPRLGSLLEAHLAGCAGCRAELAGLRRAVNVLRVPPPSMLPDGLLAEFRQRLESEAELANLRRDMDALRTPAVRRPLFPRVWLPAGAAATLLVAVIAGRAWWSGAPVEGRRPSLPSADRMAKALPVPALSNAPSASLEMNDSVLTTPEGPRGAPATAATPATHEESRQHARVQSQAGLRRDAPTAKRGTRPAPHSAPKAAQPKAAVPTARWRDSASLDAARGERKRGLAAATRRPRILLPAGIAERDEDRRETRRQETPVQIAGRPLPPKELSTPGRAGRGAGSGGGLGPLGTAAPPAALSESARAEPTGWVAIRFVPLADASAPGAFAPPAGETASALQRAAADAAAPAGPGRQLTKRSASSRGAPGVPDMLLDAMRREVNVIVSDVPLAELVARLGESARVGMSLTPQVSADTMRVTADLRGIPLHQALSKLAEAARLVIAPRGDSLTLAPQGVAPAGSKAPVWSAEWGAAPRTGFAEPAGVAPKQ